ncbi:hypothetical protein BJX70DRAFT_405302 [Aspergillus crustosus]
MRFTTILTLLSATPSRLTRLDSPSVQQIDFYHQHGGPQTIYTFQDATNATGITQLYEGTYAVATINKVDEHSSVGVWTLHADNATATRVFKDIPGTSFLNGLAAISSSIVLAADTLDGGIYHLNLATGISHKILTGGVFGPGINGLRYQNGFLYYTNTLQGIFGRIAITPTTGAASSSSAAQSLASGDLLVGADDFALAYWTDAAFITNFYKNTVVHVDFGVGGEGSVGVVVEGIPAPTTATFGSAEGLFVATSGSGEDEGASIWSVAVLDEP